MHALERLGFDKVQKKTTLLGMAKAKLTRENAVLRTLFI